MYETYLFLELIKEKARLYSAYVSFLPSFLPPFLPFSYKTKLNRYTLPYCSLSKTLFKFIFDAGKAVLNSVSPQSEK